MHATSRRKRIASFDFIYAASFNGSSKCVTKILTKVCFASHARGGGRRRRWIDGRRILEAAARPGANGCIGHDGIVKKFKSCRTTGDGAILHHRDQDTASGDAVKIVSV